MRTSLAAVFAGPEKPLAYRQFAVADPQGAEILVRILGCTLCGSDLHTFEGRRSAPVPSILGHEIVGRIEAFGPVATRIDIAGDELQIGDRVTWSIVASCGECFYCRRDLPQKCVRLVKYGHEALRPGHELTGGMAEYCVLAPGTAILRLPESLSLATACPAGCATATIAAAVEAAGDLSGKTVLITGAGMLGLTACAMTRAAGATAVVCVDVQSQRLARAAEFGATHTALPESATDVIAEATGGFGVDAAFELSGSPAAFESALPRLRIGGTLVLVGAVFPSRPISLEMEQIVRRHLTLRGIHNYAPRHLATAVRFLAESRALSFDSLVGRWLPLSQADQAFQLAANPDVLRVGVSMDSLEFPQHGPTDVTSAGSVE